MQYTKFKNLIDNGDTIHFDTNCFLSLYNFSSSMLDNYLFAFNEMPNEIKISPRVKLEFEHNQDKIKKETQKESKDLVKSIEQELNEVSKKFSKLKRNMKRNNLSTTSQDIIDVDTFIFDTNKIFRNNKVFFIGQSNNKEKDFQKINEFIKTVFNSENILPEKNESEKIRCTIDGYVRAKHNYPPGYMDMKDKYYDRKKKANKQNKGYLNTNDLTDYLGDYFIWTDILYNNSNKGNLFVTNDLKEDWWEIPKEKKLKDYSARRELIAEFSSVNSSSSIEFIPFYLFVYYLTIYFGLENFESYFIANVDRLFNIKINDYLIDNLNRIIETGILDSYEVNKGLKVQDYNIEIDYIDIDSFELLETEECVDSTENDKVIIFDVDCYFYCEGTWNVDLGLEDGVFDSTNGKFIINKGILSMDIKIGFDTKEVDIDESPEGQELFEAINYQIIKFKDVDVDSIKVEEEIRHSEESDDYFI